MAVATAGVIQQLSGHGYAGHGYAGEAYGHEVAYAPVAHVAVAPIASYGGHEDAHVDYHVRQLLTTVTITKYTPI